MPGSYQDNVNANAEMLKKAEEMYKTDLKNLSLERGLDIDEIEKNEHVKAISEKLNMLREEKKRAFNETNNIYTRDTKVLNAIFDNQKKSNIILNRQEKELKYNIDKISNMKGDMLTLRRQIEISSDQTHRRNYRIFLLKSIFVYLLMVTLPILFLKNKSISNKVSYITIISITVLFVLLMLWIFYNHKNRDNLRFNVRHWPKAVVKEDELEKVKANTCFIKQEEEEKPNIDKLVEILEEKKQKSIEMEDYTTAQECSSILKAIEKARLAGDPLGGYSSEEEIKEVIEKIKSQHTEFEEKKRRDKEDEVVRLKQFVESNKSNLANLENQLKTNESDEDDLRSKINEIVENINNSIGEINKLNGELEQK